MPVSRTLRIAAACLVAFTAVGCSARARPVPAAPVGGLDDAGYLSVADRLQIRLGRLWNEAQGRYDPGDGGTVSMVNADLLLVHAAAARAGHAGPARDDRRARLVAAFLTSPQIWRHGPRPGWREAPGHGRVHQVFTAEVAEGLAAAFEARAAIGLDAATADRIRVQLARVARSRDWRWPALVLNQLNWYASVAAADAAVNGRGGALAANLRRQLARFAARARGNPGNFGPGLRFHYQPTRWPHARMNFDSAEYANIVLGFSRVYGQARAAGMPRPRHVGLLREWVRRALAGYWTHAGYLNWDTGLGFSRWHQRKKLALAQAALIGVAAEPELQPSPRWGEWAKWMFDAGLRAYVAISEREGAIPAGLAYGVDAIPQSRANAYLAAARHAANAMRALRAGLGRGPASEPPALYAFDPDTGRLAVTTPAYNTAIVPVNHRSMPYGGLDLARLFDARQEVAANIGGTGSGAFGVTVRSRTGRTLLRTQYGARGQGPSPLELVRAPRRPATTPAPLRAYAGPFTDLRVRGRVAARGLRAVTTYRFTPEAIQGRWEVSGVGGRATATFPSWGRGALVIATLRDGSEVAVSRRPLALGRVRALHVRSARSGYTIVPRGGLSVRLIAGRPQGSQPHPGPTVEVRLGPTPARFGATIAVDRR